MKRSSSFSIAEEAIKRSKLSSLTASSSSSFPASSSRPQSAGATIRRPAPALLPLATSSSSPQLPSNTPTILHPQTLPNGALVYHSPTGSTLKECGGGEGLDAGKLFREYAATPTAYLDPKYLVVDICNQAQRQLERVGVGNIFRLKAVKRGRDPPLCAAHAGSSRVWKHPIRAIQDEKLQPPTPRKIKERKLVEPVKPVKPEEPSLEELKLSIIASLGEDDEDVKPLLSRIQRQQATQPATARADITTSPSVVEQPPPAPSATSAPTAPTQGVPPSLMPSDFDTEDFDTEAWLRKCFYFGQLFDPLGDGNCAYRALSKALRMESTGEELRLRHYDFVDLELKKIWPTVRQQTIDHLKARIFFDGIRGNTGVAKGERLPECLWLSSMLIGTLAQAIGRMICTYDSRKVGLNATYPPVEGGDVESLPIGLLFSKKKKHWRLVKLKEDYPLPPVDLTCWGKHRYDLLKNDTHARMHAKWRFWARVRKPENVGCGCQGFAP